MHTWCSSGRRHMKGNLGTREGLPTTLRTSQARPCSSVSGFRRQDEEMKVGEKRGEERNEGG
jgi:hypothetical protein